MEINLLNGWKTYIAGVLAIAGSLYYLVYERQMDRFVELFSIGLGLIGLRHKLDRDL